MTLGMISLNTSFELHVLIEMAYLQVLGLSKVASALLTREPPALRWMSGRSVSISPVLAWLCQIHRCVRVLAGRNTQQVRDGW